MLITNGLILEDARITHVLVENMDGSIRELRTAETGCIARAENFAYDAIERLKQANESSCKDYHTDVDYFLTQAARCIELAKDFRKHAAGHREAIAKCQQVLRDCGVGEY